MNDLMESFRTFILELDSIIESRQKMKLEELTIELSTLKSRYSEISERKRKTMMEFNIIHSFGLQRSEYHHSDFIGWLLDPHGSHCEGFVFLQELVNRTTQYVQVDEKYRVRREAPSGHGYVDIVVEGPEMLMIIENKLFSPEGPKQTERYYHDYVNKANHRLFVPIFLTPQGSPGPIHEAFIHLTYADIGDILSGIDFRNHEVRILIEHYVRFIENNLSGGLIMDDFEGFSEETLMFMEHASMIEELRNIAKNDFKVFRKDLLNRLKDREWWSEDIRSKQTGTELRIFKDSWKMNNTEQYHFISIILYEKSISDGWYWIRSWTEKSVERDEFFGQLEKVIERLGIVFPEETYQLRVGTGSFLQGKWPCNKESLTSETFMDAIIEEFDRFSKLIEPIDRVWNEMR